MDLAQFFLALQGSGRVAVQRAPDPEHGGLERALREFDGAVRLGAPAGLPPLDVAAATWAVEMLYAACVLFAHRDEPAETVAARLAPACPSPPAAPATHYAVDLAFRHLPELWRLARGFAPGDPLVQALRELATRWPLSSVGIAELGAIDVRPLLAEPGLRRLYVDRVLHAQDRSRAADPAVAAAIAAAVGEHPELARDVLLPADIGAPNP